jgi:hypothetical protein
MHWLQTWYQRYTESFKCAVRITLPRPGRAGGSGAHPERSPQYYAPGGSGSRRGGQRSTLQRKRRLGGRRVGGGGGGRRRAPPWSSRPLPAPPWARAPWTRDEWRLGVGRQGLVRRPRNLRLSGEVLAGDKRRRAPAAASRKATMKWGMSHSLPSAVTF